MMICRMLFEKKYQVCVDVCRRGHAAALLATADSPWCEMRLASDTTA